GLVAAWWCRFKTGLFGCADGCKERNLAVVVVIHTHAEIDFFGAGVGVVGFVQTQDGITGGHFDAGEDRGGHLSSKVEAGMKTGFAEVHRAVPDAAICEIMQCRVSRAPSARAWSQRPETTGNSSMTASD